MRTNKSILLRSKIKWWWWCGREWWDHSWRSIRKWTTWHSWLLMSTTGHRVAVVINVNILTDYNDYTIIHVLLKDRLIDLSIDRSIDDWDSLNWFRVQILWQMISECCSMGNQFDLKVFEYNNKIHIIKKNVFEIEAKCRTLISMLMFFIDDGGVGGRIENGNHTVS